MSIIGNNHSFEDFKSGKSIAIDSTQRLCQVSFKGTTDANGDKVAAKQSRCVSVPKMSLTDAQVLSVRSHVMSLMEKAQDSIVRDLVLGGSTSVNNEQISFDACVEWLDSESEGGRFTKDDALAWFAKPDGVGDMLMVLLADKLGMSDTPTVEQELRLQQSLNRYRDSYASLAGGKKSFQPAIAKQLKARLIEVSTDDDVIAGRFIKRLEKMEVVEDTADLI